MKIYKMKAVGLAARGVYVLIIRISNLDVHLKIFKNSKLVLDVSGEGKMWDAWGADSAA